MINLRRIKYSWKIIRRGSKGRGGKERENKTGGGRCSKAEGTAEGKGMAKVSRAASNPRTLKRAKENAKSIACVGVSLVFPLARRTPTHHASEGGMNFLK